MFQEFPAKQYMIHRFFPPTKHHQTKKPLHQMERPKRPERALRAQRSRTLSWSLVWRMLSSLQRRLRRRWRWHKWPGGFCWGPTGYCSFFFFFWGGGGERKRCGLGGAAALFGVFSFPFTIFFGGDTTLFACLVLLLRLVQWLTLLGLLKRFMKI